MSDLPELLEALAGLMTEKCNALILSSGGELFGIGDLRPIAAELIDYTLNREFGTDAAFDGSQALSGDAMASEVPKCLICGVDGHNTISICDGVCVDCDGRWSGTPRPEGIAVLGQCAECPYKLTGVMAYTGCPNCPHRQSPAK